MRSILFSLAVLCSAVPATTAAQECPPTAGPSSQSSGTGGDGLIAIIDPDTGQRTSDPSKAVQLPAAPDALARYERAHQNVPVVVNPDGSMTADISGLPQTPLVAEVQDGETVTCHALDDPEGAE